MPGRGRVRPAPVRRSRNGSGVSVRRLVREGRPAGLRLKLVAGAAGLEREILMARVQRPGLALTGYTDYVGYGRVQILGGTEVGYLARLSARERGAAISKLLRRSVTCFIVTRGLTTPSELISRAERKGVPVLQTPLDSTPFVRQLTAFLEPRLAQRLQLHGVLVDVFGLGVLITGESGIGKSECALDLVDRGHRLVADDVVEMSRVGDGLLGASPGLTRHHMELRGLGVINIKDLYGVSAVRTSQRVELVVHMERWEVGREYDRLGLAQERREVLGLEVPLIRMPVAPGRSTAMLVEVAARNQLLKDRGYDAARTFADRVNRLMETSGVRTRNSRGRTRR